LSPLKISLLEAQTTMKLTYSEDFIEQAVVKLLSRGERSVQAVATDLNINYHTAKFWLKRALLKKAAPPPTKERRPQDWSTHEQLVALHETHGLAACRTQRFKKTIDPNVA
jgi:transposase-like protein